MPGIVEHGYAIRIRTRMASLKRIWLRLAIVRKAFRYALPLLSVLTAFCLQGILQHIVPPGIDFPYAFFYLIAAFVSAWYGGYVSGTIA